MNRLVLCLFVLIFSNGAVAKTFLCVGEAAAGVEHGGPGGITSSVYDPSNQKLVLSDESGKWELKKLGKDYPIFDSCPTEYFCSMSEGFSGVFLRGVNGIFTYSHNQGYGPEYAHQVLLVVKGRCSKL